ncbi:flagellar brake protein [Clostridium polynesiense]|uniref:flagellar brake protein n=1 Tax=Clostridium polynesiense TaxID=1325933 RepID=UPI00058ED37D|nr:PilZ domain-containing protein [Clostridium polynesiense]
MKKFKIELNNRLEVIWEDKIYKSTVQNLSEDLFSISIPIVEREYLPIESGSTVEIVHYDGEGNIYQYKSDVVDRIIENKLPQLILNKPLTVKKVQRRNFVRVNMMQLIKYNKINFGSMEELTGKAILIDLSGGGMKIQVKEELQRGDNISALITYENKDYMVNGEIVRIDLTPERQRICGVSFSSLNESTRENIIKIVFDVMRKQRELL